MSLPQSAIDQLKVALEKERVEKRGWIREIDRLNALLDDKELLIIELTERIEILVRERAL